jgi:glutamate synthase (ferredoxin)
LVARTGVGTIASGVVKGLADSVCISGGSGGTGASPLSSIKHTGMPWALGLVEAQRSLMKNGLRDRVRLSVDGGLKSGRDVIMAALLGADEYCFGTAALLAQGCVMARSCHLNTCPSGIATQDPRLRKRYSGSPEMVVRYMRFVAQEVREYLSLLGLRSLQEAIGRNDLLYQPMTGDARVDAVDLSVLLKRVPDGSRCFKKHNACQGQRSELGDRLAHEIFPLLLKRGGEVERSYTISNEDRTVGAALGGRVAREFGERAPPGKARLHFLGSAGQSFGAFLTHGIELELVGEANDYVGKSMGGGRIVIRPPADDAGTPHLAGNALLYGATGGELFVAGAVGERFAVRNSGSVAVVEGAGRHACEYMTGGTVVILGEVGPNAGAGMTGGELFVCDQRGCLPANLNRDFVTLLTPDSVSLEICRGWIQKHLALTHSPLAREILHEWEKENVSIWHVVSL